MFRLRIAGLAVAGIVSAIAAPGIASAQLAPLCPRGSRQVRLLYPYLDNFTEGADTTLTITNTTNTSGPAASGACTITFYGSPSANFTTAPINPGNTYTNPVSALNAGFQGYATATCCFGSAVGVEYGNSGTTSFSYPAQVSVPLTPLEVPGL
jgi:hypothetical protein